VRYTATNVYERVPYILGPAVQYMIDHPADDQTGAQMKKFDFRSVLDNSIVDRLVKEGFFEKLFGPGIKAEEESTAKLAFRYYNHVPKVNKQGERSLNLHRHGNFPMRVICPPFCFVSIQFGGRRKMKRAMICLLLCASSVLAQSGAKNGEWRTYGADLGNTHYSPLDQINASNFNKLEVAWHFKTDNLGPRPEYQFEGTPLFANGIVYSTAGTRRSVIALDASTGELLWTHNE